MEQDLQLIEAYLSDELDKAQRSAFESRLVNDADFAEIFKRERSMRAFLVKDNNKDQLVPKLENFGDKYFDEKAIPEAKVLDMGNRRIWRLLAVAATVALLVLALRFFLFQPTLYEQYAAHTPISLVVKSENVAYAAEAESAFNQGNYQDALELLDQYLLTTPNDTKALLAKGISALELERYEEARNIFNQIYTSGNTTFKDYGAWYLALLNIKQSKLQEALPYLEQIPASTTDLYPKAQQLINKIQKQQ